MRVGRPSAAITRVVALGAGDGAVEALKGFFIALDEAQGMAFVIALHGEAADGTQLLELLRCYTELPVREIRSGDLLQPEHVFVAPPGVGVELEGNRFVLRGPAEPSERRSIIDRLFCSIAHAVGERAVGVVLAGSGRDGSLGVQAIARAGGVTLATEPGRSAHDAMPCGAIATGVVNYVLSPFQMPEAVATHGQAPALSLPNAHRPASSAAAKPSEPVATALERRLLSIHAQLHGLIDELNELLGATQLRAATLESAHTHAASLLWDSPLAVIELDERLAVRGFGGDLSRLYELGLADLGKPLVSIPHRAQHMPELPPSDALDVTCGAREQDVVTRDRWYIRRVLPRYAAPGARDGVWLLFFDVTRLKLSEAGARAHEPWLRAITDTRPALISFVDEAEQLLSQHGAARRP